MKTNRIAWKLLPLVAMAGWLSGCAEHMQQAGEAPPPPPGAAPPPTKSYDYSHKVTANVRAGAGRKVTVAILRFGDTKDVDGQPFGEEKVPPQSAGGQTNVNVKVNVVEGANAPAGEAPRMPKQYREMLKHALVKSEAFTVVERERILEVLREINFGKTKYVDPASANEEGGILAVRYLIEGNLGFNEDKTLKDTLDKDKSYRDAAEREPGLWDNIFNRGKVNREQMASALRKAQDQRDKDRKRREFGYACYLSAYEVRTGAVAATVLGLGSNYLESIEDAVEELIQALGAQEYLVNIAYVSQDTVYLDAGQNAGMKPGMRYQVMRQGKPVRDANGQIIGYDEKEAGEIEVVDVKPLLSVAKVVRKVSDMSRGDAARPAKH